MVNNCALVDEGELTSLKASCEPVGEIDTSSDWSVNGTPGGASDVGTVEDQHAGRALFTAPDFKPTPEQVAVSTTIVNNHRTDHAKVMLVSNVTIVDSDGWFGTLRYSAKGTFTSTESGSSSTLTWTKRRNLAANGLGSLKLSPSLYPGSLTISGGSGDWTESMLEVIDSVDTRAGCPYNAQDRRERTLTGVAQLPSALYPVVFTLIGDSYSMQLDTLTGSTTGNLHIDTTGTGSRTESPHCGNPKVAAMSKRGLLAQRSAECLASPPRSPCPKVSRSRSGGETTGWLSTSSPLGVLTPSGGGRGWTSAPALSRSRWRRRKVRRSRCATCGATIPTATCRTFSSEKERPPGLTWVT